MCFPRGASSPIVINRTNDICVLIEVCGVCSFTGDISCIVTVHGDRIKVLGMKYRGVGVRIFAVQFNFTGRFLWERLSQE